MSAEVFEGRFETWRTLVENELPVYQPLKKWLINVKEKDGIPLYDTMQPELQITPRFSKKPSAEGFDWSIRCPLGQLTINMHSKPGDRRGYGMLRAELARWLPRWMAHFDVQQVSQTLLVYVNRLDHSTVPTFVKADGLHIQDLLKIFVQIPGEQGTFIPPCECKTTLLLKAADNATLTIRLKGETNQVGMRLDFTVKAAPQAGEKSAPQLLDLFDWAHDRIIDRFEAVFTAEAKKSFQPEPDGI